MEIERFIDLFAAEFDDRPERIHDGNAIQSP